MSADENVFHLLRSGFAGRGERPFLDVPGAAPVTFGATDLLAGALACVLSRRGVGPGDRVAAVLPKSPEAVALYLAVLRAGAVYVPLNPAFTDAELAHFLADAEPALVVGTGGKPLAELIEEATGVDGGADVVARRAGDVAALVYTSGTTGRPKGAMLTHRNLAVNATALQRAWGWRADDVLVHALPIFHVHGLFVALHTAMLGGSTVRFLPRFDVAAVRAALQGATVMMGVPTFYHRLLSDPGFTAADCTTMRLFISGSAPLSEHVHRAFAARTGHTILERYGMSEAGMICTNPLDGPRVPGTVGFPFAGYDARVADDDDRSLPEGEVGMLQIRGPSLFAGYWRNPEATAGAFTNDGFFRTGDLASMDETGRVTLHGRSSDVIITGGYNVYAKEVELVLDAVDGVVESAVVGAPDADLGEIVIAYVVTETTLHDSALRDAAARSLARYKQPRQYVFVDELPRNAMGKVQKARLR